MAINPLTGKEEIKYTGSAEDKPLAEGFFKSYFKDPNKATSQFNEFQQTGTFSKGLESAFGDYKKQQQIKTNENQIFLAGNKVIDTGSSGPLPEVTGIDASGKSIYGGTNDIVKNNKTLTGGGTITGTTKEKTPLELAQEQIAKQQAEIDKKNKEYEDLQNKGAESELTAGVIPGMSGNKQTDFLSSTSNWLQTNLQNELANLDKQKSDLQENIKGGQLSTEDQKSTLQPYEQFLDKVTKLKDINDAQIQRDQTDLKNRYNQTIDRQRKTNDLALINAQKIAAITGVGFTSGGIQGINNIIDEGNQAITDLEQERESMLSKYKDADAKLDIEYLDTITTIGNESKKALQDRYNSVITQIQKIDAEKGKATKEGLLAIKDVAKQYFDALDSQWNKDYKVMEFNYNSMLNYKKDLREQDKLEKDNQKSQLDLITKGDLTSLTDEDITTLVTDMGLDTATAKGLILTREKQKKDQALEEKKLTEMTPYQKIQYEMDLKKYGLDVAKQRLDERKFTAEQGTGLVTSGITQNRPDRNNNPGNLKAGDVGYGVDDQNHTIFGSADEGYQAMIKDITAKITGNTRTGLGPNSTLAQLGKVYAEDPNWAKAVSNLSGYSLDTKLSQIDVNKLAPAIAKQEGFTGTINIGSGDDLEAGVLGLTIGLGGTEGERKQIQNKIVQKARKDNMTLAEAKKKLGYKTGDDLEFAKTRKEDYQTLKKGISESTGNARTALTLLNSPQTAIGDVASVVGFLKTIDPSSVARESEVASVENARGILDSLSNIFAKAKEGTKLTDTQRQQLKDSIQTIVTASDNRYNEYVKDLVQEFNDRGLDATTYIPKTEVERVMKGGTAKKETTTGTQKQSIQDRLKKLREKK